MGNAKILTHCIYCTRPPDGEEHWLPRSLGTFQGNSLLKGRLCKDCNIRLGRTVDQEFIRTGHTGLTRQLLGIAGRSGQPSANVFEYRAAQLEKPIEAESASIVPGQLVPIQAVGRNPDGTLKAVQQRTLTIATTEGERLLVFQRSWAAPQLRDAAAARGLLGGKVIRAHVAPPETAAEFVARSLDAIREVFGSGPIDVYQTNLDAPLNETEYRRVRFNLSREYLRAIVKLAFHYFLWTCPWIGGDELEFEDVRGFVSEGKGDERTFLQRHDCLVDRTRVNEGADRDCHMFVAYANDSELLVTLHFFSQPVGPEFPSFAARLGARPQAMRAGWRRGHIADYSVNIPGHAGEFRELTGQSVWIAFSRVSPGRRVHFPPRHLPIPSSAASRPRVPDEALQLLYFGFALSDCRVVMPNAGPLVSDRREASEQRSAGFGDCICVQGGHSLVPINAAVIADCRGASPAPWRLFASCFHGVTR